MRGNNKVTPGVEERTPPRHNRTPVVGAGPAALPNSLLYQRGARHEDKA